MAAAIVVHQSISGAASRFSETAGADLKTTAIYAKVTKGLVRAEA